MSTYISSLTDKVHVSLLISPRINRYTQEGKFSNVIEASLFEKTGLITSIEDDKWLHVYSSFSKKQRNQKMETLSVADNKLITSGWYKKGIETARELMLALPKKLLLPLFKGKAKDSFFYTKYYIGALHKDLANTLFTFTLTNPLITSDGIKYYSAINYFQAIRTIDKDTRASIAARSSKEVAEYWSNLPAAVFNEYVRKDYSTLMGAHALFKFFSYAVDNDLGFSALLKSSQYAPLVYYTNSKDMLFTYGVSKDSFFGKNYVGRILMYVKYLKWMKNLLK